MSVKLCNSCLFNRKIHEQLLHFFINSHFIDGIGWTWNVLSTWTTWRLEYNHRVIQITFQLLLLGVVSKGWVPLLWNNAFYSGKKTVYRSSFSHKFIMIDSSAGNKTLENASAFTRSSISKAEGIAVCSALIWSSVLIIAGNLLTLLLFAVTKPLRRKSLFLVMNMAFADLMLGAIPLPFYIFFVGGNYQLWTAKYDSEHIAYRIFYSSFDNILMYGSYISAASISCERLYAVFWPFKHRSLSTRTYRRIIFLI